MASIARTDLFCWADIEELGDLERLELLFRHLRDEPLMQKLEAKRGNGRNDYPVRAVWNSILAGIVFGHPSTESLCRELKRNAQLRQVCGFDIYQGVEAVPKAYVYTRFQRSLLRHEEEVQQISTELSKRCHDELPGFGRQLGCDGKALASVALLKTRDLLRLLYPAGQAVFQQPDRSVNPAS